MGVGGDDNILKESEVRRHFKRPLLVVRCQLLMARVPLSVANCRQPVVRLLLRVVGGQGYPMIIGPIR